MISEQNFVNLLETALMSDVKLAFNDEIPEYLNDSTGKLIIVSMFSREFNRQISVEDLINRNTPKDIYELLK